MQDDRRLVRAAAGGSGVDRHRLDVVLARRRDHRRDGVERRVDTGEAGNAVPARGPPNVETVAQRRAPALRRVDDEVHGPVLNHVHHVGVAHGESFGDGRRFPAKAAHQCRRAIGCVDCVIGLLQVPDEW